METIAAKSVGQMNAKAEKDMEVVGRRLRTMIERTCAMNDSLTALNDRLFGPQPSPVCGDSLEPAGGGTVSELFGLVDRMENLLSQVDDEIGRTQRIA